MAWFKVGSSHTQVEGPKSPPVPLRVNPLAADAEPLAAPLTSTPSKREAGRPSKDEFEPKKKSGPRVDPMLEEARASGPSQGVLGKGSHRYSVDAEGLRAFIENGIIPVEPGRLALAQGPGAAGTHRIEFNLREGVELEPGMVPGTFGASGVLRPARHLDLTYLGRDPESHGEDLPLGPGAPKARPAKPDKAAPKKQRALTSLGDERTRALEAGRTNAKAAQKLPPDLRKAAQDKIRKVLDADQVNDLGALPGNRLERIVLPAGVNLPAKLISSGEPIYSIRVNEQYRVAFNFGSGSGRASNIYLLDYHRG